MVSPHPVNAVMVGGKPVSNYVIAAVRMLSQEGFSEIVVKARGNNIAKAVEVAERIRKTLPSTNVKDIRIFSEYHKDSSGRTRRVSAIEIVIARTRAES
ncbi:MAG: DNA/RNA-binding protein AlbA [Acidilobaceae archaeon]